MEKYIIRRLLMLIPVLLGISIFAFSILHLTPGDPALMMLGEHAPPQQLENLRRSLGLDEPLPVQYFNWLSRAVQLDFGRSLRSNALVINEIANYLPNTAQLAGSAVFFSVLIGIPIGIISAVRPNSLLDNVAMVGALAGVGMPAFWQAIMFILIFSVTLGWFPSSGKLGGAAYFVLPTMTLATVSTASIARMTRSAMLEVISQDYIRTARSKGLNERRIVYRHALRNALIPVVTIIGLQAGALMTGAVLTETIFAWPGIGRMIVEAIRQKDFPVVQGVIMTFAVSYALINLFVDILYAYLDPKIRVKYK